MPRIIIADTSCLIILSKIGEIDLLQQLYNTVTITKDIALEFGEKLPHWIEKQQVRDSNRQEILENTC